ncbi:MAG TPA: response regulator [Ferruginibacter sp.]|jgi:DNA-binding response OmpR family regulator|nr:response regulator [Ferruginibacter sp.]
MPNKIIIYDDDVDILEVCSTILRMRGFEVLCKNNCRDVIKDIADYDPDVILMDNWLPDIGGVKSVQLIKGTPEMQNIPVIFFSANSHVEQLAREAGADYMLQKPFELTELEQIITKAVTEKSNIC